MPARSIVSRAICASRQVLEISPGKVPSLRDAQATISARERVAGCCQRCCAACRRSCVAPVVGQAVVGVGEAGAGLVCARRLARLFVGLPGDHLDAPQRVTLAAECRVDETLPKAFAERVAAEHAGELDFANLRSHGGERAIGMPPGRSGICIDCAGHPPCRWPRMNTRAGA